MHQAPFLFWVNQTGFPREGYEVPLSVNNIINLVVVKAIEKCSAHAGKAKVPCTVQFPVIHCRAVQ